MNCVMSVQHTGTWFVIRLLEKLLNCSCVVSEQLYSNRPNHYPALVHFHIGKPTSGCPNGSDVIQKQFQPYFMLEALSDVSKVVIPIRDPMRALITRHNRHSDLVHTHIVDGFRYLASNRLSNVFYFPIDLYDCGDRCQLIKQLCQFLDIDIVSNELLITQYAVDWAAENSTADKGLHQAYNVGDLEWLQQHLGLEIDQLTSDRVVRDFMKRQGYGYLPWYQLVS